MLFSTSCLSEINYDLYLGAFSRHIPDTYTKDGSDHTYVSNHTLVGLRNRNTEWMFAVFVNSYGDPSIMYGKMYKWNELNPYISPQFFIGGAYGYGTQLPNVGGVAPYTMVGFDIHPKNNRYGLTFNTVGSVHTVGFRLAY